MLTVNVAVILRICDSCPLLDDVVMLAGLFRALVIRETGAAIAGRAPLPVRPELLEGATWRAASSSTPTATRSGRWRAGAWPAFSSVTSLLFLDLPVRWLAQDPHRDFGGGLGAKARSRSPSLPTIP